MGNWKKHRITVAVLVLFASVMSGSEVLGDEFLKVTGSVVDEQENPIPGASVYVMEDSATVAGGFTDDNGRFEISLRQPLDRPRVRITSVGFEPLVKELDQHTVATFALASKVTVVKGISVKPRQEYTSHRMSYKSIEIEEAASASLIPSNPLSAIKSPMAVRAGSNHSSTLRVHGTNPVYSLNGLPIGSDPAHYGTFAIIPSSVVDRLHFQSLGSNAPHRLPTFVELETPSAFGQGKRGQASLSTIDANLFYQVSNKNTFLVGSVRKSVLDHLVNNLNIESERATLPPTNFSDFFISGGIRLSPEARLIVDNYRVDDFLFYNTGGVGNGGHTTLQKTEETYYAARLELLSGPLLVRANLATRRSNRAFSAEPNGANTRAGVNVDISEQLVTNTGRVSLDYDFGTAQLSTGVEVEADIKREFNLEQTNWNFLPPFSPSDNPYIYQRALNNFVDHSSGRAESRSTAGYVSWMSRLGRVEWENGLRAEKFDQLQDGGQLLMRNRLSVDLGDYGNVSLFAGNFAQNPVDNILEPFQVLVREDLNHLSPVKSTVHSMRYKYGPVELALFHKKITNLPLPTHEFGVPSYRELVYRRDFIKMQSTGQVKARGITVAYDEAGLIHGRVDLYAFYSFTSTFRVSYNLSVPYEFDAPHRFMTQLTFRPTANISLGSEIQIRSGYPYSPIRNGSVLDDDAHFTAESFSAVQSQENSRRFPINAHLNLNAQYNLGQAIVFLSLFNVTNRANPIVSSSSGMVHDAGILPMLGLKYNF